LSKTESKFQPAAFFPFLSSFPLAGPLDQTFDLRCGELWDRRAPSSRQIFYGSLCFYKVHKILPYQFEEFKLSSILQHPLTLRGCLYPAQGCSMGMKGERAHSGTRSGSAHRSGVVLPRPELLPQCSRRRAGKRSVRTVWTWLRLALV